MEAHREQKTPMPQQGSSARRIGRWLVRGLVALSLIALGALGSLVFLRSEGILPEKAGSTTAEPMSADASSDAEVEVVLSPEAMLQAGVKTAPVSAIKPSLSLQVPAVVMPNAYREVKVTPLVGGLVRKVHAELGASVKSGAPLATLFSTELADAQTKYLSMRAMLDADHQKLERTRRARRHWGCKPTGARRGHGNACRPRDRSGGGAPALAPVGHEPQACGCPQTPSSDDGRSSWCLRLSMASSRAARQTSARWSAWGRSSLSSPTSRRSGSSGTSMSRIFGRVRVGSEATLMTPAYPELRLKSRASYIDPRIDPQTRTAKVRVEVPNAEGYLRLGMYLTITFTTAGGTPVVVVPRAAVQTIGARQVVFVAVEGEEGRFIQRTVDLGRILGESYTVVKGLEPGEVVVTEGSFFLRAESLRNAPSS